MNEMHRKLGRWIVRSSTLAIGVVSATGCSLEQEVDASQIGVELPVFYLALGEETKEL